jgi:hypothetical protein
MTIGLGMFGSAAGVLVYNLFELLQYRWMSSPFVSAKQPSPDVERPREPEVRWNFITRLALLACLPTFIALGIEVTPGM